MSHLLHTVCGQYFNYRSTAMAHQKLNEMWRCVRKCYCQEATAVSITLPILRVSSAVLVKMPLMLGLNEPLTWKTK